MSCLTADGVEIIGAYVRPSGTPIGAVLLLHMMPAVKESWSAFSALLAERGLASLAIDLRGHGESTKQGDRALDYRLFEDEEHLAARLDVEAAAEWLYERQGFDSGRLAVAGASIGANLSLWFASLDPACPAALALSPGLNYRGLTPETDIPKMRREQAVFLAASEDDTYAFSSVHELEKITAVVPRTIRLLKDAGHGTTMFERDPAFMREAGEWLAKRLGGL